MKTLSLNSNVPEGVRDIMSQFPIGTMVEARNAQDKHLKYLGIVVKYFSSSVKFKRTKRRVKCYYMRFFCQSTLESYRYILAPSQEVLDADHIMTEGGWFAPWSMVFPPWQFRLPNKRNFVGYKYLHMENR